MASPLTSMGAVTRCAWCPLCERADVASVDLNPLILRDGAPVAVDALVEISEDAAAPMARERPAFDPAAVRERFQPLFHPRGIVVAGVSNAPKVVVHLQYLRLCFFCRTGFCHNNLHGFFYLL